MELKRLDNEKNLFKLNIERYFIINLKKRINEEVKVQYTEDEIKHILEVTYNTDNLYQRLRNILINEEISVSIRRLPKNSIFTFYNRIKGKQCELNYFKEKFRKIIPKIESSLKTNYEWAINEQLLRNYFNICDNESNFSILRRIRRITPNNYSVYIEKNKSENSNLFIFTNKENEIKIREEKTKIKELNKEEIRNRENERKLKMERLKEEEIKKIESLRVNDTEFMNKMLERFPPPPSLTSSMNSVKKLPKEVKIDVNIENDSNKDFCPKCNSEIKYLDKKCEKCGIFLEWT